jgi:hypothetical protein
MATKKKKTEFYVHVPGSRRKKEVIFKTEKWKKFSGWKEGEKYRGNLGDILILDSGRFILKRREE